jgi:hypothetical protein
MGRRLGPAVRTERAPSRLYAGEMAEPRDELAIGEGWGRLAGDLAVAPEVLVELADVSFQAFVHGTRTEDEQVVVGGQAVRDVLDELPEVLEAVWLAGRLRTPASTVANHWVVPDMAGGATVGRHLGVHPLDMGPIAVPADDDRLTCVDPDEGAGWHGSHERAHAGRVSLSAARSA